MNRLKDKIAIVTGTAGGQGTAEARLFAAFTVVHDSV
jgi:NAD(P)-dependent dehydrogenase (short-subunit alcohol dehydrogenase family)